MIFGVALLIAAGGLAWLSVADRMSPLAMEVVEVETALGVPLWVPIAALGVVALVMAMRPRSTTVVERRETQESERQRGLTDGRGQRTRPPPSRVEKAGPDAEPETDAGTSWRAVINTRALRLPVGPQGRMKIDEVPEFPFTLLLRDCTPQQAKNRYALFAELLAGMPTPPAARVRLESCPEIGGPIQKPLAAELARFFAPGSFHVVGRADGADVRFAEPDGRWS